MSSHIFCKNVGLKFFDLWSWEKRKNNDCRTLFACYFQGWAVIPAWKGISVIAGTNALFAMTTTYAPLVTTREQALRNISLIIRCNVFLHDLILVTIIVNFDFKLITLFTSNKNMFFLLLSADHCCLDTVSVVY